MRKGNEGLLKAKLGNKTENVLTRNLGTAEVRGVGKGTETKCF